MSSSLPNTDHAFPYTECAWHAAWTSGRALWISLWMAKAAALMGSSPTTTSPASLTRMRSETVIREKCVERGLSQKWSVRMGSRTELGMGISSSCVILFVGDGDVLTCVLQRLRQSLGRRRCGMLLRDVVSCR